MAVSTTTSRPSNQSLIGCHDNPVDLYFLLDCSSSIWIVDYQKQLQFVVSLVRRFDISPNATRVGLGVFSNDFRPVISLGQYNNRQELEQAILKAPYLTGNSYTERGLRGLRLQGFQDARPNVTKVGVVVTDGRSQNRVATVQEARQAKEAQISIFTIGVGRDVDENELAAIASEPTGKFRHLVASFDILATLVDLLAVSTCSLSLPQADPNACGRKNKADIMFVYRAASMSAYDVDKVKDFIRYAVSNFSMTSGNVRVGIISQGCNGGDVQLSEYLRRDDLLRAVSGLPGAPTYASVLRSVRERGFDSRSGARHDAIKMAVLFVDEALTPRDDASYQGLLLKYDDVQMHVVAVGPRVVRQEVADLATAPAYLTTLDRYDQLDDAQRREQFLQKLCQYL